jgi:hypothetical protein
MQALSLAHSTEDATDSAQAVKLLASISIDALPSASPTTVVHLAQTLASLTRTAAETPGTSDGSQKTNEETAVRGMAGVVRAEGYTAEWVKRVLMCYGQRLRDRDMRDYVVTVAQVVQVALWCMYAWEQYTCRYIRTDLHTLDMRFCLCAYESC